jgi:FeS assembly SUF system regulator
MVRISRLSDYGIQLLATLARQPGEGHNSRGLADSAAIPEPTVRKLLKVLSKANLLISRRGAQGGYRLARSPDEISVGEIIAAIEGPVALTRCNEPGGDACDREQSCPLRGNWQAVNQAIQGTLAHLTLSQMAAPSEPAAPRPGGILP